MISKLKFLILGVSCLLSQHEIIANNIVVSNVTLTGQNTTAGGNNAANFTMVRFDITWENSWKTSSGPANYDAAWVFVKYRVGNGSWQHASLNNTGHTAGNTGATITTGLLTPGANFDASTNPGLGVFISRSADGTGTFTSTGNQLRWNYGANGVIDVANVDVKVFAIEMVYIPEGAFSLGSGGSETMSFTRPGPVSAQATVTISGGTAISTSVTETGAGFVTPPTVTNVLSGSGFNATANLSNGTISSITINNGGSGYSDGTHFLVIENPPSLPFTITSENAITLGTLTGNLWAVKRASSTSGISAGTLTSSYPKGFAPLFCMKYEISQGQYRDFLNTLTYDQQVRRTQAAPNSAAGMGALTNSASTPATTSRNGIDIQTPGVSNHTPAVYACNLDGDASYNETNDGEWIACNLLSWSDGTAYADWAGLRPMSELEFEKICRGTAATVANEYVWGSTDLSRISLTNNSGNTNELPSTTGSGLSSYKPSASTAYGPIRVGATATASTNRVSSGSTFYGVMDMGGNVGERVVSAGNSQGQSFTGLHGDGVLSNNGNANTSNWPGIVSGGEVTDKVGSGSRGGEFVQDAVLMQLSNRNSATDGFSGDSRSTNYGFRGVRRAQ